MRTRTTIAEGMAGRTNGLNALRLIFAVLVIVSHSWVVAGFGPEPSIGNITLGQFAVGGFFVISGYLVTQSRERSHWWSYAWRRARRIFPGYWVCLAVTAFGFAVVVGLLNGGWEFFSALRYVRGNALFIWGQGRVGHTLADAPYRLLWNGSLWTLRYEVVCYAVAGLVYSLPWLRRRIWPTAGLFLVSTAATLVLHAVAPAGDLFLFVFLFAFFAAGATLYKLSGRVPVSGSLTMVAVVLLMGALASGHGRELAPAPLAYVVFVVGLVLPAPLARVGTVNDFSYGTYLYAWPVQQCLVLLGVQHAGPWVYVPTAILTTAPFAVGSWYLIERPANRIGVPFRLAEPVGGALPALSRVARRLRPSRCTAFPDESGSEAANPPPVVEV